MQLKLAGDNCAEILVAELGHTSHSVMPYFSTLKEVIKRFRRAILATGLSTEIALIEMATAPNILGRT
jgi:hypothetical protein